MLKKISCTLLKRDGSKLSLLFIALVVLSPMALAHSTIEIEAMHSKADHSLPPISEALKFSYSKESKKEFDQAVARGKAAIDKAIEEKKEGKEKAKALCVVSDIDETILDNRPFIEKEVAKDVKEVNWEGFAAWVDEAAGKPLKPSIELLAYARKKGLAVFLISGRVEKLRRATITNLVKYGIAYDGLYLRGNDDKSSAIPMKSAYRKQIESMGYEIVVNIGDQFSDLAGGYSIDCEKLPNKMYYIQ
ncbi:HAD family acid phosphatase [bacterium]|jgi:5'-nucleotidase (lipoprotein e(P4) family)|nr:HAD family acid phosphatase [bacterium]